MTVTASATYRDVFAVGEFRALFAAHLLSLLGDQLSKVAISVLVFGATGSTLLAAIAFGVSYLPWVVIGPVLTALSDRFPRRTVMVACDLARAVLIGLLVIPGLPTAMQVIMLFASAVFAPPAQAARSATLPEVLDGDKYVVAGGVNELSHQLAQVIGFAGGGALVSVLPARGALLVDAATFAISALLVAAFVHRRPVAARRERTTVARDTAEGVRLVMSDRRLRAYVMLACIGAACTIAPEGLMTAYAARLGGGESTAGLLLAAMPLGCVVAAIVYGRFTAPARRWRLVRPMALLSCLALVPMLADPPVWAVLALLVVAGYGTGFQVALNARFVQAVPAAHRGKAFGVAVAGMMGGSGLATALAGALADLFGNPALVVGLCGVAGVGLMALVRWPHHGGPLHSVE
ncbi:MFS transporter [Nonomuraea sp. NPDC046802]|uniref:MFS transporter n=1 Tax=Nonomuraea sp. NPDC046802 TaxID=3154919 RepID=UPI0033E5C64C